MTHFVLNFVERRFESRLAHEIFFGRRHRWCAWRKKEKLSTLLLMNPTCRKRLSKLEK